MELTKKNIDLANKLKTAPIDQMEELDHQLATMVQEISPELILSFFNEISEALAENKFLPTYEERPSGQPEVRNDSQIEFLPISQQRGWKHNRGSITAVFGDIVKTMPKYYALAQDLDDLISLIKESPEGIHIDIMGAGLSLNGLYAQFGERLIFTESLNRKLPFDDGLYHKNPKTEKYYQTEAGVKIPKLLDDINHEEMALSWGGYTPQSLFGAASTSTHKSGFLPPLIDYVLSADVVLSDGNICRIEPKEGITNKLAYEDKYRGKGRKIVQDDGIFYATLNRCSIGVVYSVILQASERYSLLMQKSFYDNLNQVHCRGDIEVALKSHFWGNPWPWQIDLWVMPKSKKTMLIRHVKIPYDSSIKSVQPPSCWECLAAFFEVPEHAWRAAYGVPETLEKTIDFLLHTQRGETKLDWRHFMGGNIPAFQMKAIDKIIDYNGNGEIFDEKFIAYINAIGKRTGDKKLYFNSPMGVRFVGESKHAMSMFKKEGVKHFVALEQPFVPHSRDGQRILRIIDEVISDGRSHWGQNNLIEENKSHIIEQYGEDFNNYLSVRQRLTQGKPDKFKLPRDLDLMVPSPIDPKRYYRILENAQWGYLTIQTAGTGVRWLASQKYDHNIKQYFYFTPIQNEKGWYHIRTYINYYWTMDHGGHGIHAITFKDSPQEKKSKFRLELKEGAYTIHELTNNEILSIGLGGHWNGHGIRAKPREDQRGQRFWLYDTGPVVQL